jgi:hypothetical protein
MAKRNQTQRKAGPARTRREPATDYDSPWKEALDRYFEQCLALFFPQAHADIDWSRGHEMLDKELQPIVRQAQHGRRYVDKLVKVWLKSGEERWLLIHVEVVRHEVVDVTVLRTSERPTAPAVLPAVSHREVRLR